MAKEPNLEFSDQEREAIVANGRGFSAFEDIPIEVTAILGTADINIANLLKIGRGAVIELNQLIGQPIELQCQGRRIGEGEVVVTDNNRLAITVSQMLGRRYSQE